MAVVTIVDVVDVVAVTVVGIISRGTRRRSEVCHVWRSSMRRHGDRKKEIRANRKERDKKGKRGGKGAMKGRRVRSDGAVTIEVEFPANVELSWHRHSMAGQISDT